MGVFSGLYDHPRTFSRILVHPTQELPSPQAFRGGPDWPNFEAQIFARHCWGAIPRPIDFKPHPACAEWPYFDRARYLNPRYSSRRRWRAIVRIPEPREAAPEQEFDSVDHGFWCGAVNEHFGVMVAHYGMRIAASSHIEPEAPLVFSIYPLHDAEPPAFFWEIISHLGVDRRRVMLVRKPTRFSRLSVVPQAERPFGGGPSARHLRLMEALTGSPCATERDQPAVFVSRSRLDRGNIAGESFLDEAFEAAGIRVFHPQAADLHTQLQLYRKTRRLIFSEGSALHALQLLGRINAEIIVLTRRPGDRLAAASLRPRARSLRYLDAISGIVHGVNQAGEALLAKGISVLDDKALLAKLKTVGIDLAPYWDASAYRSRRDASISAWIAQRLASPVHPLERSTIERSLARVGLSACMREPAGRLDPGNPDTLKVERAEQS